MHREYCEFDHSYLQYTVGVQEIMLVTYTVPESLLLCTDFGTRLCEERRSCRSIGVCPSPWEGQVRSLPSQG